MIWNGATEEAHRKAGANGYSNPPPPPSAPPAKTKSLSIILHRTYGENGEFYHWLFIQTTPGIGVICTDQDNANKKVLTQDKLDGDGMAPWPAGTYGDLGLPDIDCEYKNDGKGNSGKLWCGKDRKDGFECAEDNMRKNTKMRSCGGDSDQQAIVYCDF